MNCYDTSIIFLLWVTNGKFNYYNDLFSLINIVLEKEEMWRVRMTQIVVILFNIVDKSIFLNDKKINKFRI